MHFDFIKRHDRKIENRIDGEDFYDEKVEVRPFMEKLQALGYQILFRQERYHDTLIASKLDHELEFYVHHYLPDVNEGTVSVKPMVMNLFIVDNNVSFSLQYSQEYLAQTRKQNEELLFSAVEYMRNEDLGDRMADRLYDWIEYLTHDLTLVNR